MLQFLLDTDHLTLFDHGHALVVQHVAAQMPGTVGLPAVTAEEYLRGRLTAVAQAKDGPARIMRYALFVESLRLVQQFEIAPFDQASEDQFQVIRAARLRVGTQDQKIAAIAVATGMTLVTRNKRDFAQIAGLHLTDWSV
jgi:tRNA(fMet)-specific endonuclease VapC